MSDWALVKGGVVANIIVVNDDPAEPHEGFDPHAYVADDGNEYETAADITTLDPQPRIGWVVRGTGFVRPEVLESSKTTILGNDTDAATVTYTDNRPDVPETIDGTVNGATVTLDLNTKGVGSFDVTSSKPGDTVTVEFGGTSISIGVE